MIHYHKYTAYFPITQHNNTTYNINIPRLGGMAGHSCLLSTGDSNCSPSYRKSKAFISLAFAICTFCVGFMVVVALVVVKFCLPLHYTQALFQSTHTPVIYSNREFNINQPATSVSVH